MHLGRYDPSFYRDCHSDCTRQTNWVRCAPPYFPLHHSWCSRRKVPDDLFLFYGHAHRNDVPLYIRQVPPVSLPQEDMVAQGSATIEGKASRCSVNKIRKNVQQFFRSSSLLPCPKRNLLILRFTKNKNTRAAIKPAAKCPKKAQFGFFDYAKWKRWLNKPNKSSLSTLVQTQIIN